MSWVARLYYRFQRWFKAVRLYLVLAGPGVVVMIADNDAGGITTYAATGAKYEYHLIWFLVILGPVAYYVQEMTVRLGAVTKRGHAEAIFDGFGPFWGWFSLLDLLLVDWLTLVTEFIGMTAALAIFGVPAWADGRRRLPADGDHGAERALLDLGKAGAGVLRSEPDLHPRRLPRASAGFGRSRARLDSQFSRRVQRCSCSSS